MTRFRISVCLVVSGVFVAASTALAGTAPGSAHPRHAKTVAHHRHRHRRHLGLHVRRDAASAARRGLAVPRSPADHLDLAAAAMALRHTRVRGADPSAVGSAHRKLCVDRSGRQHQLGVRAARERMDVDSCVVLADRLHGRGSDRGPLAVAQGVRAVSAGSIAGDIPGVLYTSKSGSEGAHAITVGQLVQIVVLFQLVAYPVRLIGYALSELPRSVVSRERLEDVFREAVTPPVAEDRVARLPAGERRR